jgi:hypothetical protein
MDKRCKTCGQVKPLGEFYRSPGMKDGHRNDCKTCNLAAKAKRHRANPLPARERAKQWAKENPERVAANHARYRADGRKKAADRRSYLKRTYGITPEDYDETLAAQGGVCAICGRKPRSDISLHVDHDHESGRRRGLLCFKCNNALGDFRDDIVQLQRAVSYLLDHDPTQQRLAAITHQRLAALTN